MKNLFLTITIILVHFSISAQEWNNEVSGQLTTNDKVGIGTDSPKDDFHVNGNYYGKGHFFLHAYEGDGNSGTAYIQARDKSELSNISLQFRTQNNGLSNNILKLTYDGKVGIGTDSPKDDFHVNGNYYGKGHFFLHAYEGDGNSGTAYIQARDKSELSNISLQFRTQNNGLSNNILKLTYDGKVGIGTDSPKDDFHVNGNYYGKGHFFLHAYEGDGNSGTAYIQARDKSELSNISLQFRTQNNGLSNNILKLTYDGKAGIGTDSPTQKLDVKGNIALDNYVIISKGGSSIGFGEGGIGNEDDDITIDIANDGELELNRNGINSLSIGSHILLDRNNTTKNVGIGTDSPDSKLTVAGNIHSQEVKVTATAGADFVFEESYDLRSLEETEAYIKTNKHLPEIKPADEMVKEGIVLGEMNIKLLQKIEELTLYLIEQNKENKNQQALIESQHEMIEELRKEVTELKNDR